jgi:hypothetical protein
MVCLWPAGRQIREEIPDFPREPGSTAAVRIRLVATKQQPACAINCKRLRRLNLQFYSATEC